jgi:hypothetical protein
LSKTCQKESGHSLDLDAGQLKAISLRVGEELIGVEKLGTHNSKLLDKSLKTLVGAIDRSEHVLAVRRPTQGLWGPTSLERGR